MEEKAVVDASIVVKWFIEEEHSDQALSLREAFATGRIQLHAPALMPYEVLNALARSALFTGDELVLIARSLSGYGFEISTSVGDGLEKMAVLCAGDELTAYDAAYVALAQRLKARLYTADVELLKGFPDVAIHIEMYGEPGQKAGLMIPADLKDPPGLP